MDSKLKDSEVFKAAIEAARSWGQSEEGKATIRKALEESAEAARKSRAEREIDPKSLYDSYTL